MEENRSTEQLCRAAAAASAAEAAAETGVRARESGEEEKYLKPWEQHSSVISIPRFDYAAPSSLLHQSHSGFLITCPIKREKSATKEAISIFEKLVSLTNENFCSTTLPYEKVVPGKRRKTFLTETDAEYLEVTGRNECKHKLEEFGRNADFRKILGLSLVKVTRSGLLLFIFPSNNIHRTVDMVSMIFELLGSGELKSPLWCHRVFPIQETCVITENNLQRAVSKLVQEYFNGTDNNSDGLTKFAVAYNRRGVDEKEICRTFEGEDKQAILLSRDECFKIVAKAVKDVAKNTAVDLKSPKFVVLVELLPVSGVPHGSALVGVSLLPQELVTTKPRLCVRTLLSDTTGTKREG